MVVWYCSATRLLMHNESYLPYLYIWPSFSKIIYKVNLQHKVKLSKKHLYECRYTFIIWMSSIRK